MKILRILGTRGVPASHGGFETFAEQLAIFLVRRGWRVVVYCQKFGNEKIYDDVWNGVERVHIPVWQTGTKGTILFDWKSIKHACQFNDICLTLGYNTALFCSLLRLKGIYNVINMDGLEWKRAKWGLWARIWLWLNERAGCWIGNHLIADHPEIKKHLESRISAEKITVIPYGADLVSNASLTHVYRFGLVPKKFITVIARGEPENSILQIVRGFSSKHRNCELVILGSYYESDPYHRQVRAAASKQVHFVGPIFEKEIVQALRFFSILYVHGHQVGGTNPSLVEALGAGNPIIAHDNHFNRWVAGDGAIYFNDAESFSCCLENLLTDPKKLEDLSALSLMRFRNGFVWSDVLQQYEELLLHKLG